METKTYLSTSGTLVTYMPESEQSVVCMTRENKIFSISHISVKDTELEIQQKELDSWWKLCGPETTEKQIHFYQSWKNTKTIPLTTLDKKRLQRHLNLLAKLHGL